MSANPMSNRRARTRNVEPATSAQDTTVQPTRALDKRFTFDTTTVRHTQLKAAATLQGKKINEVMNELMQDYINKNFPGISTRLSNRYIYAHPRQNHSAPGRVVFFIPPTRTPVNIGTHYR